MRKYQPLTQRRILWLFRHGYYTILESTINSPTPEIYGVKFNSNQSSNRLSTRHKPIRIRHELCHRGYRHVRLYYKGRRASIALHKLVWMVVNNSTVPPSYEVHHRKSKKLLGKCHDGIGNLELLNKEAHAELHTEEFLNGRYSDNLEGRCSENEANKQPPNYPSSWDDI